jgi:hypothetical protein
MTNYRSGAQDCRAVLKSLPDANWHGDQTDDEYFAMRDAAIARILETAGPMSEQAAGAMAVLAEFIVSSEQDACYMELGGDWVPRAAMTNDAWLAYRAGFAAEQLK